MNTKIIDKDSYIKYTNRIQNKGIDGCTPVILIDDMVNKIDLDWSNSNLRILDPCFGFGGYLFFVYLKLKQYHSDEHILNNMLYGIEIEPFRFTLVKEKFKIKNLYNSDFLNPSKELKQILDMKFDVIIGNPPYSSNTKEPVRLWASFIERSFSKLKDDGVLSFITPSSWMSSTNSVYDLLKNKISYVNLSNNVSNSFGSIGGSQKFVYFIASKNNSKKCITKFDNDIEFEFNPTDTPIAPIKSSSYHIFEFVEKLYNSNFVRFEWKRFDGNDSSSGVVVPMAKAASYIVKYHINDTFDIGRYKLNVNEELGDIISHNLNNKSYQILRWVLRSGPALASNFKLLPIPNIKMNDLEIFDKLNLSDECRNFITNHAI